MDGYITTNEIAQRLGVKVETVRRWVRQGKLPGLPLGRAGYRIRQKDFDHFLQNQQPEQLLSTSVATANPSSDGASNDGAYTQMEAVATLILERMTDGILLFGLNEQCLYANDAAAHLLGLMQDELPSKTVNQILPESVYDSEKTTIQGSNDYFSAITNRWYQIRTFAALQGRCVSFLDVTERKQQQLNAAFLADLTEVFSSLSSQEEILRVAGKRMAQYFIVPSLTVAKVNEAADEFTVIYDSNEPNPESVFRTQQLSDFSNADFLREMRAGRVIVVNDTEGDPRTAVSPDDSLSLPVRAFLLASHLSEGHVDFVIGVQRSEPYNWRKDEVELLQELLSRLYPQLERVRAEQALRESEERFRRMVETYAQAVWETNAAGEVVEDSPSWRAYTGQTFEEWVGYGWVNAVHPNDRAYAERQWREAIAARRNISAEFRLKSAKGGYRWTNVRATPLFSDNGSIMKWIGMNIDLRDRKLAEKRYRLLFDAMDQGVHLSELVRDEKGHVIDVRILQVNAAWEKIMGMKSEMVIGKRMSEWFHLEKSWLELCQRVVQAGQPERDEQRAGDLDRWFDIFVSPFEEDRFMVLFTDITERKRMEQALRDSERLVQNEDGHRTTKTA
jgi:PAS domain S-box-containing protein/excisionase family DNA binding protein